MDLQNLSSTNFSNAHPVAKKAPTAIDLGKRYDVEDYKSLFCKWKEEHGIKISSSLEAVMPGIGELNLGDKVMYRNPAGIYQGPFEILGFDLKPDHGRCVYLNFDCYWFPVKPQACFLAI